MNKTLLASICAPLLFLSEASAVTGSWLCSVETPSRRLILVENVNSVSTRVAFYGVQDTEFPKQQDASGSLHFHKSNVTYSFRLDRERNRIIVTNKKNPSESVAGNCELI